jgi:capsular exopolysaccharide synthesis family protein
MSRFFDALKRANLAEVIEVPAGLEVERGSRSHVPTTPMMSAAEVADAIAIAVEAPAPPSMRLADTSTRASNPWDLSQSHRGREVFPAATALARAAVDQNVRMIPTAVDRAVVEHYRRLRTKVMQQHAIKAFRSLLVTSASPQEGKSVTVLNLALSFAMMPSFKVLVVDADLRRNTVGKWLGAGGKPGFSNLLDGTAFLNDVVFTCEDSNIHLMAGGTSQVPPAELLQSSALADRIRDLTARFDLVLVDSAPLGLVTDTHLLAAKTDAVLLVARAFKTTTKSLERAVQDLLPFRVIGTVLNGGPRATLYRGYGGYY